MKNKKGITLIEVTLYVALATIVMGILFSCGWNIVILRIKSDTIRETENSANFIQEKIKREIRSSTDVDESESIFGQPNGKIVLNSSNGEIIIDGVQDKISINRNDSDPIFLHSDYVRVKNLIFTRQISSDDQVVFIGFTATVEAYYSQSGNRFEYNYSVPIGGGVEIRKE